MGLTYQGSSEAPSLAVGLVCPCTYHRVANRWRTVLDTQQPVRSLHRMEHYERACLQCQTPSMTLAVALTSQRVSGRSAGTRCRVCMIVEAHRTVPSNEAQQESVLPANSATPLKLLHTKPGPLTLERG